MKTPRFMPALKVKAIVNSCGKGRIGNGYRIGDILTIREVLTGVDSDHFIPYESTGVAFYLGHFKVASGTDIN